MLQVLSFKMTQKIILFPCRSGSSQRTHSESSINVYDKVYEHITDTAKSHDHGQTSSSKNIAISDDKISLCCGLTSNILINC